MEVDMTAVLQKLTELRDRAQQGRVLYQQLQERSRQRLEQQLQRLALLERLEAIERRLTRLEERAKD